MNKKMDKMIAELLDEYDNVGNDVKCDPELIRLFELIENINQYLERD